MRTISKWFLGGAVVFALVAVLWGPVVVPTLTKYPTKVDTKIQYTGTFTTYMDQKTGLPLAQPVTAPLTIDRHVKSVNGEYGAKRAVVQEIVDVKVAGQVIEHQDNQYVIDRKSMKNVDDPRAYAFVPSNKVNRAGSYAIQFPMNIKIDTAQYKRWKNETSSTYDLMKSTGPATTTVDGLKVVRMGGVQNAAPVSAYYGQTLKAQGLPDAMSAAQMKATLKAKGIDVDQSLTGLAALLTPAELQTAQQVFNSSVPISYQFFDGGQATIEPKTGAPVSVTEAREGVVAVPDLSGLAALRPILVKYSNVPAVAAAAASLDQLSKAPPQTIFEMRFSQTAASTADVVKQVKSQVTKLNWVKTYIRIVFAGLAILLLVATLLTFRPRRPEEAAKAQPLPKLPQVPKAA